MRKLKSLVRLSRLLVQDIRPLGITVSGDYIFRAMALALGGTGGRRINPTTEEFDPAMTASMRDPSKVTASLRSAFPAPNR